MTDSYAPPNKFAEMILAGQPWTQDLITKLIAARDADIEAVKGNERTILLLAAESVLATLEVLPHFSSLEMAGHTLEMTAKLLRVAVVIAGGTPFEPTADVVDA